MNQEGKINEETMETVPMPTESMDEVEESMEIGEFDDFTYSNISELGNANVEEEEMTEISKASMKNHIMDGCDDFEVKENEKGFLTITFKKQTDGKYQCMVKTAEGTRCETRGKVKEIRACIKKHGFFKGLYRERLIFMAQDRDMLNSIARARMQKRNFELFMHAGRVVSNESCRQFTRKHVRCKCTVIPLFRVCLKHLQKDDAENTCKNEYVDDDVRTAGGLQSCVSIDGIFKVYTYKTYVYGQAITTYEKDKNTDVTSNLVEGLLEPYKLDVDKPDQLGMGFKMRIDDTKANCQAEYGENNILIVRCCVSRIEPITLQNDIENEENKSEAVEPVELILKSQIQAKLQDKGKVISIKDGYMPWLLGELKHTDRMLASGTFTQLDEQYPLLVDNQLIQFNEQLLLGKLTALIDSYKTLIILYHSLGNAQYQTVKTISKSVEEVADKFKDTYMEAEFVIESYEVMRQRNVAIMQFNNESEADNNFQDEQVNQIDDT
jgi:hypothetical protein